MKKYRTRQSIRESQNNVEDSSNSSNLDMPSTSTGITSSNNAVYRIIEEDSDDEVPPNVCNNLPEIVEQELINILPTPLNGTHDMYNESTDNATNSHDVNEYTDTDSSMYESEGVVSLTPNFKARNGESATPESGIGSSGACSSSGTNHSGGSQYRRHLACSSSSNGNGSRFMQAPLDDGSDGDQEYIYERFKQRLKKVRVNIRNQIFGDSDSN